MFGQNFGRVVGQFCGPTFWGQKIHCIVLLGRRNTMYPDRENKLFTVYESTSQNKTKLYIRYFNILFKNTLK